MVSPTATTVLAAIACIQLVPIWSQSDELYEAQADFAVSLLQEVSKTGKSVVLSPLSITTALSMIHAGANGRTREQISSVLARGASFKEFVNYVQKLLDVIPSNRQSYTLDVANCLYVQQQLIVDFSFREIIRRVFGEGFRRVDFRQNNAATKEINGWVASRTHDKIGDLVSSGSIGADTAMMLLSAAYFKGNWKMPFNKNYTSSSPFYMSANNKKELPMMVAEAYFPYFAHYPVQILGLPYNGDQIQMFLILPMERFDLHFVLKRLTGRNLLDYIKRTTLRRILVNVPRFKLDNKLELAEILQNFGLTDSFNEKANFWFLNNDDLPISAVTHKAFIEVNEGMEATDAQFFAGSPFSLPTYFNVDQPFLFAIVKDLNKILFIGQFAG